MTTLNRQRATILFSHLANTGEIFTPAQVSSQERIFARPGLLKYYADHKHLGHCKVGVSMSDFLWSMNHHTTRRLPPNSYKTSLSLPLLLDIFSTENYILWRNPLSRNTYIVLKSTATTSSCLKAWYTALLLAREVEGPQRSVSMTKPSKNNGLRMLSAIEKVVIEMKDWEKSDVLARIGSAGWDLSVGAMETGREWRIEVNQD